MKMYRLLPFTIWTLLFELWGVYGGKVLVFPVDGSHWINMKVIIEELHSRGHDLTVIRSSNSWYIKEMSPHYTSITIPNEGGIDEQFFETFLKRMLDIRREGKSAWAEIRLVIELIYKLQELHEDMIKIMTKIFEDEVMMESIQDAKYDVVLSDPALGGGAILAHHFNIPLVFNARWTVHGEGHFAIAPSPLSYVPIPGAELTDKMTFFQRVINVLVYIFGLFQQAVIVRPYTTFCHKYFGPDFDYFSLFQNADIWLMRNDFIFEFPRPTMPNAVYISGFQCKPSKPLPGDLEEFLQSSGEHGVIVMSLGTIVSQLPQGITEDIAAAFSELPQKVIWRYTGPHPMNLGNNTLLVDWLQQNDLLGHPKTKVFVAHGGTNGIQEAIYHGVPILGLPLALDQPDNLFRMKVKGTAKLVDIATLNKTVFLEALKEVLYNSSYRNNMQRLSRMHRDQPMKPLDRAAFWIEFVMRNRGVAHLRTQSFRMSWIAYHSVDVILTLLGATLFTCWLAFLVVKKLYLILFQKKVKLE